MRPICHTPERGCSRRLVLWIGSESPVPHVLEGALACQLNSKTFTKNAASSAYGATRTRPPDVFRTPRTATPRSGRRRHRLQRPRPSHRAPRPRTADPGVRRRARDRTAHRRQGDRPRALCHRRIGHHRQHPAVHLPVPRRRRGAGAQRKPHQLRVVASQAGGRRRDLPLQLRHRSAHAPDPPLLQADLHGQAQGGAQHRARRVRLPHHDRGRDDRRARPERLPTAVPRQDEERRLRARLRDLRSRRRRRRTGTQHPPRRDHRGQRPRLQDRAVHQQDAAGHLLHGIHLLRPPGLQHLRRERALRPQAHGRAPGRGIPGRRDMVIGVPNSSLSAASGYAEAAHLPNEMG